MMSDPVTNTEIEDVLTSIRRLVSENRPDTGAADPVEAEPARQPVVPADVNDVQDSSEAEEGAAPLALVLTPSLRVTDSEPQDMPADDATSADNEVHTPEAVATVAQDYDDGVAQRGDEADDRDDGAVQEEPDVEMLSDQEEAENSSFSTEDDAVLAEEPEVVALSTDAVETVSAPTFDETPVSVNFEGDAEDPTLEEDVDEEQPFDFKQVLEARIHQFREAKPEEAAPVESPDAAMAQAVVADLEDVLSDEVVDAVTTAGADQLGEAIEPAAEIDEAMLREMVADIVRQELQGALGERITRNVRKLVRREIHRALAAHDLG